MKKIYFMFFAFLFCIILSSCLWCQLDEAPIILENAEAYITPEKDTYSQNEMLQLHFSLVTNFSYYQNYGFGIFLEKYDEQEKKYKVTRSIICYDIDTKEETTVFSYRETDTTDNSKVTKIFSLKPTEQGDFFCRISGSGYHYDSKGVSTATSYEKYFYFTVSE